MKRKRDYNPSTYSKRQRLERAAENQFLIRGGFQAPVAPKIQFAQPRAWVARTPGGNIVADNHYFDSYLVDTAIPVSTADWSGCELDPATINCLFAPAQGDDIAQRTGRKVFVKNIRIRGSIIMPAQATQSTLDVPPRVRIVIYCDKQTNATQSQAEDVIASGNVLPLNMFQSTVNFGRFKVLKDKTYILNGYAAVNNTGATGGVLQGSVKRDFKFSIKINMWVNYNAGTSGNVGDIVDNSWHFIACTDGAATAPTINYRCRTTFDP